jgi:hypothetical protein
VGDRIFKFVGQQGLSWRYMRWSLGGGACKASKGCGLSSGGRRCKLLRVLRGRKGDPFSQVRSRRHWTLRERDFLRCGRGKKPTKGLAALGDFSLRGWPGRALARFSCEAMRRYSPLSNSPKREKGVLFPLVPLGLSFWTKPFG